jgi:hypothetical protein
MATYQELKGAKIKNYTEDPDNPYVGQLWYNTSTDSLRIRKSTLGSAWSSGANLNTARKNAGGAGASSSSALAFGGNTGSASDLTELYNGSSWTEVNDLNTGRGSGGAGGTQTSAIFMGGAVDPPVQNETELWNGTNWTEVGNLNTARYDLGGAASVNTNALAFAGYSATGDVALTESWNGSSWTEVADLNDARQLRGCGTSNTNALAIAGYNNPGGATKNVEAWQGSAWYEVNDTNADHNYLGSTGSTSAAIVFGGSPTSGPTELWNGAVWTATTDMSTNVIQMASNIGTSTNALSVGGRIPAITAVTEEWNQNLVVGSWLTAAFMNTAKNNLNGNGAGTSTAGLVAGGNPPFKAEAEIYNGNVWAEVNDLNKARYGVAVEGTQTSALAFGGVSGDSSPENAGFTREGKTETWNGTSWTEVNDMNTRKSDTAGAGADNTAALSASGKNPQATPTGILNATELWNGTNWTAVNDSNQRREGAGCVGTSTQSLIFGGYDESGDQTKATEVWNGTNWTEVNDLAVARGQLNGFGTYTSAIAHGGTSPSDIEALAESWNGTSWSRENSFASAKTGQAGIGTSTSGLAAGGHPTNGSTFEWVGTGIVTETVE